MRNRLAHSSPLCLLLQPLLQPANFSCPPAKNASSHCARSPSLPYSFDLSTFIIVCCLSMLATNQNSTTIKNAAVKFSSCHRRNTITIQCLNIRIRRASTLPLCLLRLLLILTPPIAFNSKAHNRRRDQGAALLLRVRDSLTISLFPPIMTVSTTIINSSTITAQFKLPMEHQHTHHHSSSYLPAAIH